MASDNARAMNQVLKEAAHMAGRSIFIEYLTSGRSPQESLDELAAELLSINAEELSKRTPTKVDLAFAQMNVGLSMIYAAGVISRLSMAMLGKAPTYEDETTMSVQFPDGEVELITTIEGGHDMMKKYIPTHIIFNDDFTNFTVAVIPHGMK